MRCTISREIELHAAIRDNAKYLSRPILPQNMFEAQYCDDESGSSNIAKNPPHASCCTPKFVSVTEPKKYCLELFRLHSANSAVAEYTKACMD